MAAIKTDEKRELEGICWVCTPVPVEGWWCKIAGGGSSERVVNHPFDTTTHSAKHLLNSPRFVSNTNICTRAPVQNEHGLGQVVAACMCQHNHRRHKTAASAGVKLQPMMVVLRTAARAAVVAAAGAIWQGGARCP